jgi:hypothetical protein
VSIELLQTIIVAVLTNGSVLALFLWVFKVVFEKALDKRAKLFEVELELQHRKERLARRHGPLPHVRRAGQGSVASPPGRWSGRTGRPSAGVTPSGTR